MPTDASQDTQAPNSTVPLPATPDEPDATLDDITRSALFDSLVEQVVTERLCLQLVASSSSEIPSSGIADTQSPSVPAHDRNVPTMKGKLTLQGVMSERFAKALNSRLDEEDKKFRDVMESASNRDQATSDEILRENGLRLKLFKSMGRAAMDVKIDPHTHLVGLKSMEEAEIQAMFPRT
ncbi:hypothetical protein ACHAPT_006379 [Fusarium lateritium]